MGFLRDRRGSDEVAASGVYRMRERLLPAVAIDQMAHDETG